MQNRAATQAQKAEEARIAARNKKLEEAAASKKNLQQIKFANDRDRGKAFGTSQKLYTSVVVGGC